MIESIVFALISITQKAQEIVATNETRHAVETLRAEGYTLCDPEVFVRDLDDEEPMVFASAAWSEGHGVCEVEIDPIIITKYHELRYVYRHEACHLATGNAIHRLGGDYHEHYLFEDCIKEDDPLFTPRSERSYPRPALSSSTTTTRPTPTTTTTTQPIVVPVKLSPLEKVITQIGKQETEPYSVGGFWCARFLSWALNRPAEEWDTAGEGIGPGQLAFHYPTTDNPQPGDLVTIDLMGKGQQPTHIGMVEKVEGTTIHTIEGNPSVRREVRQIGDGYVLEFHTIGE